MIRTERDYQAALTCSKGDQVFATQQRRAFANAGLTPEQIEVAMAPTLAFHAQLQEEIQWYERVKGGDVEPITSLTQIGRFLVAVRIARGLTQRELAARLGVDESQVSRDERNEYHGVTVERAQRVLEALGARTNTRLDTRLPKELVNAR